MKNNDRQNKSIIIILLVITLLAVCFAVWALFFRDTDKHIELTPDHAPKTEENAETIPNDSGEKLEQSEGGGAVSLTYSNKTAIDLSEETVQLMFANPGKSNKDMVVQIVIQDEVIVQSGTLSPGNQVKSLKLLEGAADKLTSGGYDGKFVIYYYDPETGEREIVNTEIPITVSVSE